MQKAFAPSTTRSYQHKFRTFLAFCVFVYIDPLSITTLQFLAFLEFLVFNQHSCANVANYVSAVKTKLASLGVSIAAFHDHRVTLFGKELKRNRPFRVTLKPVLSIKNLKDICQVRDTIYLDYVY